MVGFIAVHKPHVGFFILFSLASHVDNISPKEVSGPVAIHSEYIHCSKWFPVVNYRKLQSYTIFTDIDTASIRNKGNNNIPSERNFTVISANRVQKSL